MSLKLIKKFAVCEKINIATEGCCMNFIRRAARFSRRLNYPCGSLEKKNVLLLRCTRAMIKLAEYPETRVCDSAFARLLRTVTKLRALPHNSTGPEIFSRSLLFMKYEFLGKIM